MNLVVISGGRGLEHQISIKSATHFCSLLDASCELLQVRLAKDGDFWLGNLLCFFEGKSLRGANTQILRFFDYVFPIVHGVGVENGELQGFFSKTPLISNSLFSSVVSFDKIHAKQCSKSLSIPVLPFVEYNQMISFLEAQEVLHSEVLFLKPSDNGSSFGCYKVSSQEEFEFAINGLNTITHCIMIEPFVKYAEVSCSVLFDEVSDVILVRHNSEWFSYKSKYVGNSFKIEFLEDLFLVNKIQRYALDLFHYFRMTFCCRFDFFVDFQSGTVFFNEANSLPGLGERSLFFFCFQKKYSKEFLANKMVKGYVERYF